MAEAWRYAGIAATAVVASTLLLVAVGLLRFGAASALVLAAREPGIFYPVAHPPLVSSTRIDGSLVVFIRGPSLGSVGNSLLVALSSSLAATVAGLVAASSAYLYRGVRRLWWLVAVAALGIPFVEAYVVERLSSLEFGLPGLLLRHGFPLVLVPAGLAAVALYEALAFTPFAAAIVGSYLFSVPREEVEAAIQMGARGPRLLLLLARLAAPAVAASFFFGVLYVVDDVSGPFVFSGDPLARSLLSYRAYTYFAEAASGLFSAQGVGYAVLLLLVALPFFAAAYIVQGKMVREKGHETGGSIMHGASPLWLLAFLAAVGPSAAMRLFSVAYAFSDRWVASLLPELGLGSIKLLAGLPDALKAALNSGVYAAVAAAAIAAIGGLMAWHVARRLPCSGLVEAAAVLPLAVPGVTMAYGLLLAVLSLGGSMARLLLSWPVLLLLLGYFVRRLPLYYYAARAVVNTVPREAEEAAANLGASLGIIYRSIAAPLVFSKTLPILVFVAVSVAGEVSLSVTIGGLGGSTGWGHPAPLMYIVAGYMGYSGLKYGGAMAAAALLSYSLAAALTLTATRLLFLRRRG